MELLRRALRNDPEITLDRAALDLALIEFPELAPEVYVKRLDDMAAEIARRLAPDHDGAAFLRTANRYLFEELGFRGNEADYYSPLNSCLNSVLDLKTGIPITLSLVYMELGRRLGKTILGIGLPGHFAIEFRDERGSSYLDPFHGGRPLTLESPSPVSKAYILTRMLNNLWGAYYRAKEFKKCIRALDLLIETAPDAAEHYKARAMAKLQLRQFRLAEADFQDYLRLSPDASDRSEVARQMESIQRWLCSLN